MTPRISDMFLGDVRIHKLDERRAIVRTSPWFVCMPWAWQLDGSDDVVVPLPDRFDEWLKERLERAPDATGKLTFGDLLIWCSKRPQKTWSTIHGEPHWVRRDIQPCFGHPFNRSLVRDMIQPLVEYDVPPSTEISVKLVRSHGEPCLLLSVHEGTFILGLMAMQPSEDVGTDALPIEAST